MKITKIETFVLKVALGKERFYSSQCAFPERNSLLVRVHTDDGICGWGEGGQYGPAEPVAACIEHVLARHLLGEDPRDPVMLWERMYCGTRDFGQKGTYIEAISAVDIALWDIAGKAAGMPVSRMLGGAFRDKVAAYATGCYYRGEDYLDFRKQLPKLADEAASYARDGFKMLKVKVGLLDVREDIERIKTIREAIGEDTRLFIDCNHSYNAATAVDFARRVEQYDIGFLEEPVVPEDHDGYRRVRSRTSIPIAGGECEYTRYGFRDFVGKGCVDIAQPDVCVCGGLSEFSKILALCLAHNTLVVPHVWGSGVALAAALAATAVIPNTPHTANPVALQNAPAIEFDRNINPLRDELLTEPIRQKGGFVEIPNKPGLGVELDESVLKKYLHRHEEVHLS